MKKLFYFSCIVLFSACGSDSSERSDGYSQTATTPEDSLFNVVMEEHNIAMAKTRQLNGYQKQFDQKIDSLKKLKTSATVAIQKKYESLNVELKQADDNMNKWMDEFSIDSAQDNAKRRIEYLTSEQSKVIKVKEEILSVLAKADSALKN